MTIKEIDIYITKASGVRNNHNHYLQKLSSLIFADDDNKNKAATIEWIYDFDYNKKEKRLIAIILLRILNQNPDVIISDQEVKLKTISLFDEVLQDIYKYLGIHNGLQGYLKIDALKSYEKKIEREIKSYIPTITSLDGLKNFENKLRSVINNKNNLAITHYFISDFIKQFNLDSFFGLVRKYCEIDTNEKVQFYHKIDSILNKLYVDSDEYSNKYLNMLLLDPLKQLHEIITEDFSNSSFSKKADLVIHSLSKKYPLNLINHEVSLGIIIKNSGIGSAFNVKIKVKSHTGEIKFLEQENFINIVEKLSIIREFPVKVVNSSSNVLVEFLLVWENSDSTISHREVMLEFMGQNLNINWEELKYANPYSLEAVDNEQELIGRNEILNLLITRAKQEKIGSHYIFGQRRVGKTSIAKTFLSKKNDFLDIIYIEAGDWSDILSPEGSINNLGQKICNKIIRGNKKFSSVEIPEFNGAFSRITEFFDILNEIDPNYRLILILDEFDRISSTLFSRGEIGKAFMLTIRSISNRPNYGFILIGGEKLEIIIAQWQELNKFGRIRVDYFDNSRDWEDFKTLVTNPVKGIFEYSEESIVEIYQQTAGNPYFTKLLCSYIFNYMKERKDCHITHYEVKKSLNVALHHTGAPSFSHFWEDGIKEIAEKEEEVSIARRKLFLSIRDSISVSSQISKQIVLEKAVEKGLLLETASYIFDEFIQRKIIQDKNGFYSFVMSFFKEWLMMIGYEQIIPTFEESEKITQKRIKEEQLRIKLSEVEVLVDRWPPYNGLAITSDVLLNWIKQFGEPSNQRLIFNLLSKIKFYSELEIRTKLEEIYLELDRRAGKKGYVKVLTPKGKSERRKRDDILISYVDGLAKSGAEYAKKFVDVNGIYYELAIEFNSISEYINNESIKILLLIDDISASGQSIVDDLSKLKEKHGEQIKKKNIFVFIALMTGFLKAKHRLEETLTNLDITGEVFIMDPLSDEDKCFSDNSKIVTDEHERVLTRELCYKIGLSLEKNHPLGYKDCQLSIVFPNTCPNNTLPIFWKRTDSWIPLFERT